MTAEPVIRSATRKRDLIRKKQAQAPQSLIYATPPDPEFLYTDEELEHLLRSLIGLQIPPQLGHVQKSHYAKKRALELLGYTPPKGFRTTEARAHRPRFIHQLMDIFVQSSDNLQIWNYVPSAELPLNYDWNKAKPPVTFADCRYAIVAHTRGGLVKKVAVRRGRDLAAWDRTGTKTMKWQAIIGAGTRGKYAGKLVVGHDRTKQKLKCRKQLATRAKREAIRAEDSKPRRPLIKIRPDPCLVYSFEELTEALRPLSGWRMVDPGSYGTRVVGQAFEREVAARLGYVHVEQTDTGDFPDLLHQLLEVKFQYSPTVDLGRVLPVDRAPLREQWNEFGLQPRDIRYLIALAARERGEFIVTGMVLISGDEFPQHFGLVEGQSFKVQLRIPDELFA